VIFMTVNNISANSVSYSQVAAQSNNTQQPVNTQPQSDVVSTSSTTNNRQPHRPDWNEIQSILAEGNRQAEQFRQMVERLLQGQAGASNGIASGDIFRTHHGRVGEFLAGLEVDDATQAWAAEQIGENGYWGVEATSERLLGFARAFAGNDVERLELMRSSFIAGFGAAGRAWGSTLPDISQRTFDAVMQGFDSWRAEIEGTSQSAS
jgi:hypothetical protein